MGELIFVAVVIAGFFTVGLFEDSILAYLSGSNEDEG